jgi:hypothetical protein
MTTFTTSLTIEESALVLRLLRAEADRLTALACAHRISREDEDVYLRERLPVVTLRDRLSEEVPVTPGSFFAQFTQEEA